MTTTYHLKDKNTGLYFVGFDLKSTINTFHRVSHEKHTLCYALQGKGTAFSSIDQLYDVLKAAFGLVSGGYANHRVGSITSGRRIGSLRSQHICFPNTQKPIKIDTLPREWELESFENYANVKKVRLDHAIVEEYIKKLRQASETYGGAFMILYKVILDRELTELKYIVILTASGPVYSYSPVLKEIKRSWAQRSVLASADIINKEHHWQYSTGTHILYAFETLEDIILFRLHLDGEELKVIDINTLEIIT